MTFQGKE